MCPACSLIFESAADEEISPDGFTNPVLLPIEELYPDLVDVDDPTVTADQQVLMFNGFTGSQLQRIFFTSWTETGWSLAQEITVLESVSNPVLAADGNSFTYALVNADEPRLLLAEKKSGVWIDRGPDQDFTDAVRDAFITYDGLTLVLTLREITEITPKRRYMMEYHRDAPGDPWTDGEELLGLPPGARDAWMANDRRLIYFHDDDEGDIFYAERSDEGEAFPSAGATHPRQLGGRRVGRPYLGRRENSVFHPWFR